MQIQSIHSIPLFDGRKINFQAAPAPDIGVSTASLQEHYSDKFWDC